MARFALVEVLAVLYPPALYLAGFAVMDHRRKPLARMVS